MILSRRAALDGAQLDEIDERILISGIEDSPGTLNRSTAPMAGGTGSWLTNEQRTAKRVSIKFQIRLRKTEMAERAQVLEKVTGWARKGGWLTVNTRENRRIRVRCAQEPEVSELRSMTKEYTVVFEANEKPYWELETPTSAVSGVGGTGNATVAVEGNLDSPIEFELHNESGMNINTAAVNFGTTRFVFDSLGLGGNETLVGDHDERGILRLRIRSASGSYRSVMDKLAENSSDDLMTGPGNRTVYFTAQRACKLTAKSYGRFA